MNHEAQTTENNMVDETPTPEDIDNICALQPEPSAEEKALQEAADLRDQLLRLAADFDNYRKRTQREAQDMRRYSAQMLACDLLTVIDSFDRALMHTGDSTDPFVLGMRMVAKQLSDALGNHGITRFATAGQPFDPAKHEALGQCPSPTIPEHMIIEDIEAGYMLHDRLLRPAKVVVSSGNVSPQANNTSS